MESKEEIHATANLPWHTVALIVAVLAVCAQGIPSPESLDEIANPQTFLQLVFPEHLTVLQMGTIRLFLGSIMIVDSLWQLIFGYWEQDTEYHPNSKLKPVKILFRGIYYSGSFFKGSLTLSYFTYWVWILEGFTFLLIGGIPIAVVAYDWELSPWIYRLAIVGWEVVAPASLLVSTVVKYVLWPMALRSGNKVNLRLLQCPMSLVEHNLNFIAVLTEVTLLGGLPVRYRDLTFSPLLGVIYVLFSYNVKNRWADERHGPQFIYPFFDPTIGWFHTASLLALLLVQSFFHIVFCWLDHFLTEALGRSLQSHAIAAVFIILLVCRFRD